MSPKKAQKSRKTKEERSEVVLSKCDLLRIWLDDLDDDLSEITGRRYRLTSAERMEYGKKIDILGGRLEDVRKSAGSVDLAEIQEAIGSLEREILQVEADYEQLHGEINKHRITGQRGRCPPEMETDDDLEQE
jgi:SMC interacting uncharacterized protein involved in chromosome segregation